MLRKVRIAMTETWERRRKRVFEIVEVGNDVDWPSRVYDFSIAFFIILNLAVSIMYTFNELKAQYGFLLVSLEEITVAIFCVDYILRI